MSWVVIENNRATQVAGQWMNNPRIEIDAGECRLPIEGLGRELFDLRSGDRRNDKKPDERIKSNHADQRDRAVTCPS